MIPLAKVQEFEDYLNHITDSLGLGQDEKDELKEEWKQHLVDLMSDFIQKGASKSEAIELSIKQFGEIHILQSEVRKSFLNPRKMHLLKESLVWIICLIVASIGPILLINAYYKLYFVTVPLTMLAICYGVYHIAIRRVSSLLVGIIGTLILYAYFVYFIIKRTSIEYFKSELFSLNLSGEGLFTISMVHLLWLVLCVIRWQKVIRASFEYWSMNMIALWVVNSEILTNSGEGKVIILNIFLLYVFLQQVIEPQFLIRSKNKVQFWLKGV